MSAMSSASTLIPQKMICLFQNAIANRTVTAADRYILMAALLDRELNGAECRAVDELCQVALQG